MQMRSIGARLQSLINDIIKLSELDDSDLKLEFETVDLHELGEQCVSSMQMQAEKNEVTLQLEGTSVPMSGNKTLLEELLFNLCSNAVLQQKRRQCHDRDCHRKYKTGTDRKRYRYRNPKGTAGARL